MKQPKLNNLIIDQKGTDLRFSSTLLHLFAASFTIIPFTVLADDCVDLSHVETLAGLPLQVRQIGCDSWSRQQYAGGKPVGAPSSLAISPEWTVSIVDDQYERYENRQRWSWNQSRTSVIHDWIIQSLDKSSKETTFVAGSEVFSRAADMVTDIGNKITRVEKADGATNVAATPIATTYPKL